MDRNEIGEDSHRIALGDKYNSHRVILVRVKDVEKLAYLP